MTLFRPANVNDAAFLVPLIAESSGGVWPALWRALAEPGESVDAAGARYLTDTSNSLSVTNTVVAESNGLRVGLMTTYREHQSTTDETDTSTSRALPSDVATALQPYRELSDPDSLFIAELCCSPEARGQGLGSQFLSQARESAATKGLPRVSLRVFTENVGAVRLYERFGFERIDQRSVVPHPDITVEGSVMLMACNV